MVISDCEIGPYKLRVFNVESDFNTHFLVKDTIKDTMVFEYHAHLSDEDAHEIASQLQRLVETMNYAESKYGRKERKTVYDVPPEQIAGRVPLLNSPA